MNGARRKMRIILQAKEEGVPSKKKFTKQPEVNQLLVEDI